MLDYLGLEEEFTHEERTARDTAREFADDAREEMVESYREGQFPVERIPEMGDLGFYAPNLDGYGLAGTTDRAYGLVMQELEACDSGLRSMASVQGALVIYPIHRFGSESQRERFLPELATGDLVGCFGLTEPEHGSNPAGMETSATRDDEGYRLNGSKRWITNAPIADLALVWARTKNGDGPVRGFLVETDRDGVTTGHIDGKLSMRAMSSGRLRLDDARVPEENVLPGVEGMKGPLSCLTQARYGIAWGAVGAARDCFETALAYTSDRDQFGGPIARFQLQQEKLAEMATQITTRQPPRRTETGRRTPPRTGVDGQAQQRPDGPQPGPCRPRDARRQRHHP